jgi:hypothetical protein
MTGMRRAALVAITLLVAAASLTSFAESYRALFLWASLHDVHGLWAAAWPLQVDVFIAVGELALFVALADRWAVRSRAAAWTVTLLGLAVSVAGNVGHVASHDWASRATAAVPPLAAAAALAVGLGVLKRVAAAREGPAADDMTGQLADMAGQLAAALGTLATEMRVPLRVPQPAPGPERPPGPHRSARRKRAQARQRTAPGKRAPSAPVTAQDAEAEFMSDLASGAVPSIRQVRARMHVGQERATQLHDHLERVTAHAT